ncbi:dihydrodipicolinate synthetase [Sphingobacterium sp. DK4209]|uniref:Dihydrodipicolinate synthetase n=1 Tax=Sphingobacterium zhuxiongii TaxID=2662364 RepID=A0A5Q0Q6R9_9SPHI|nr:MULTISPECIES: dihydrodipicolinate synthase family protein [unclassified Sphingobacterium]MVZ66220.1 dihydrodipicolinate synthetase [Sphingobacterium sp. DK4209]QGA24944.1 dihydrodipicolinate synthetase [Sphingobacterium sp. dk4302]
MLNKKIEGLIAAPFTPFDTDGELNLSLIPQYYASLKKNGIKGAFICGSTGEGVALTFNEKVETLRAWTSLTKTDDDFVLMMFLGGTNVKECKELARIAEAEGADAISFTSPYYFKPSNVVQLAKCCREIAEAAPNTAFYYYHIPVLSGGFFNMIDLLKEVDGNIPTFKGIKYTHEDFMDFLSCTNYANRKYDMLWGRDENMLSALVLGSKGGVGSTYNYAAPLYHDLINAYNKGDFELANQLQQKSIDMIQLLGKYGGIATGKAYMKLIGLNCGEFRLPVSNMSAEKFENFKQDVNALAFEGFKSSN